LSLVFLGASPDGLVGEDLIVEVKCPYSAFNMPVDEAIKSKKITFWKYNQKNDTFVVNPNCPWYYQIQGQLEVTNRKGCIFGIWTGANYSMKIEYIRRRRDFWQAKMNDKLEKFYFDCLIPELVDPRHPRGMPIREPSCVSNAK